MMVLIFGLSFVASAYSIWRATRSTCDQREANVLLGVLPVVVALILYLGFDPIQKVVALGILFAAGIAVVGARGWWRLIPVYQIGFALWILLATPVI